MQIDFAANEGPAHTFDWLWRQFNQHRVLIPKLFLLADLRWFHATQTFLLIVNLLIQFLHLSLLAWSMRVFGGWRGALWRTGTGLAAFCLFCPSQWPNLLMGFTGLCCYLPPLFGTVSFIGLLLYRQKSRDPVASRGAWKYLVLCIAAAMCATFSLSNGNLLWPLLIGAAVLLRVGFAASVTLASAAVIGIAAFFYNYTVYIRASSLVDSRETLLALLKYIAVYFGSSWVQSNIRVAEMLGVAGFILFLFVLWQVPSWFRTSPALCTQLLLTLLFALGTGIVTAPGRFVFGIDQAFSGRYQSFALLFWGCMALILLGRLATVEGQTAAMVGMEVLLLAVLLLAATKAEAPLGKARWQAFNLRAAAFALMTDVPDTAQLLWADSHPEYPRSLVPYMRKERLSVFSQPEANLLGEQLTSVFAVTSANDCSGKVESSTAITTGWPRSLRITGWAWDPTVHRPPSEIVIAGDGVIAGFGAVGDWRPESSHAGRPVSSNFTGFTGYVRDVSRATVVEIYAVHRGRSRSACPIATLRPE